MNVLIFSVCPTTSRKTSFQFVKSVVWEAHSLLKTLAYLDKSILRSLNKLKISLTGHCHVTVFEIRVRALFITT